MNEEVRKILKMVEQGQIKADEGTKLIGQLRPQYDDNGDGEPSGGGGFFDWLRGAPPIERKYESQLGNNAIKTLRLHGTNAKLKIEGHSSDTVKIECEYKLKRGIGDEEPEFHFQDGLCELRYNHGAYRYMKISCKVPYTSGGSNAIEEVFAETSNGRIKLENLNCKSIECSSANASAKLENVKAASANIGTTNGGVSVEKAIIAQLDCHTTNGGIKLELENIESSGNVDAHTTNGGIKLHLPAGMQPDVGIKIEAKTTNGGINCKYSDFEGEVSKAYVNAKSPSYDSAQKHVDIKLGTTNGGITVS